MAAWLLAVLMLVLALAEGDPLTVRYVVPAVAGAVLGLLALRAVAIAWAPEATAGSIGALMGLVAIVIGGSLGSWPFAPLLVAVVTGLALGAVTAPPARRAQRAAVCAVLAWAGVILAYGSSVLVMVTLFPA